MAPTTVTPFRTVNGARPSSAEREAERALAAMQADQARLAESTRNTFDALFALVKERAAGTAELITHAEAARRLSTSKSSVRRLVAAGELEEVPVSDRVIRLRAADVAALMERSR